jgi:hypothetical protein
VNRRRRVALVLAAASAGALLWRPVRASIFGEENALLIKQLAELIGIHRELKVTSDGIMQGARMATNMYELYESARAGVDELRNYSTDAFLRDLRDDVYRTYPGFEILGEGIASQQLARWRDSHARSPATSYEMISAVFGDLTAPMKERVKAGEVDADRAYLWRYEAAGALALAADAEAWTESADRDAREIYRLAADADAEQAAHLSARALSLVAIQNSHIVRLLSRRVRFDGIRGAMEWGRRVQGLQRDEAMTAEVDAHLERAEAPPRMMSFGAGW